MFRNCMRITSLEHVIPLRGLLRARKNRCLLREGAWPFLEAYKLPCQLPFYALVSISLSISLQTSNEFREFLKQCIDFT